MSVEHHQSTKEGKFEGEVWVLENDISAVGAVGDELERRLLALGWTAEELGNFPTVVQEAVANAIIHGNLNVKKIENEEDEEYRKRVVEAAGSEENKNKRVKVAVALTGEEAAVTVFDEGVGFDAEAIRDPTDDEGLLKTAGRGIYLMRAICDRVEFSPGRVVLIKRRVSEKGKGPHEHQLP